MARVVHFEIQADDLERARAFYAAAFDWSFQEYGEFTGSPYWGVITAPEDEPGINGGLLQRPVAAPGPEQGTSVTLDTVAETEAGPEETSQTVTITDEPRWMLYTNWVTGGEITLELVEGDAATVEVLRGHPADPENPFAGIEVVEVLETVELTSDGPVTVTFP